MRTLLRGMLLAIGALGFAAPALAATTTSNVEPGGSYGYYVPRDSVVSIASSGVITAVQVNLDQMYQNSLSDGARITLTHGGKTITLLDTDKCVNTLNKITITDTSGTTYDSLRRTTCNASANHFRPYQPLSAFKGMEMSGDWKLTVVDYAGMRGSAGGRFSNFSVTVTYDVPTWTPGSWSAWSSTCGAATRTRPITCMIGTTTLADSQCTGAKPADSETSTQTTGCSYSWTPGTWTPVYAPNSRCGAQTETTTYSCRRSDGVGVADSFCTAAKPSATRPYTDPVQCTYSWSTSSWSTSGQTSCGTSTRTRTVTCYEDTNFGIPKTETLCTSPKPSASEQITDYSACQYGWYRTGYELSPCVAAKQTYRAYYTCLRSDGTQADGFCGTNPPRWVVTQSCGYWRESWGTGNWFGGTYGGSGSGTGTGTGIGSGLGSYSSGGTSYGGGIVSGGADGQSGDQTGFGNAGTGTGSVGTGQSGGTYDPATNSYLKPDGGKYVGGYYDNASGNYYGGSLFVPSNPAGSIVMMRRPVPPQPK